MNLTPFPRTPFPRVQSTLNDCSITAVVALIVNTEKGTEAIKFA